MAHNPRRVALKRLAEMKRWLRGATQTWDQDQRTYDMTRTSTGMRQAVWRPRREDEKAENWPTAWQELIDYMRAVEVRARELREFAEVQKRAAERRRADG